MVYNYYQKQLSKWSSLNGDSLDFSLYLPGVPELKHPVSNFDSITAQKLIASLLQSEGLVFLYLLEARRLYTLFIAVKERLISSFNSLADVLHSLRTYLLPNWILLPQLGNMSLKFGAIQMLFEHPIIASMQCNRMVINHPSYVNRAFEMPIPLVIVEPELQGFHTFNYTTICL